MFLTTPSGIMGKLWLLQLFPGPFVITGVRRKAAYLVRGMVVLHGLWQFASSIDSWIRLPCFTTIVDSCILFSFSGRDSILSRTALHY